MSIVKVHVVLALALVAASFKAPSASNLPPENNDQTGNNVQSGNGPPAPSKAWVVSTLAGSRIPRYGAGAFADGAGSTAQFNYPYSVAVDSSGNVYVADKDNNRIRKVTADGTVSTLAGSGTAGFKNGPGSEAQFSRPLGVAVDSSGNVYVADADNNRIRKVITAEDGTVTVSTLAGTRRWGHKDGAGSSAQFSRPHGVAVDSSGNVYVADTSNYRIRKVTAEGEVSTLAGSSRGFKDGAGSQAQFKRPTGVAVDSSGNVYVADSGNNRIRKVTAEEEVSTLAGSGTEGFANGAGTSAQFDSPAGVAVDSSGIVYVADRDNHLIRKVVTAEDGTVTVSTLAGGRTFGLRNGTGSGVRFYSPYGVAVDSSDNVYVADRDNHRIRKIEYKVVP